MPEYAFALQRSSGAVLGAIIPRLAEIRLADRIAAYPAFGRAGPTWLKSVLALIGQAAVPDIENQRQANNE